MENDYIKELLLKVKEYCKSHKDCEECLLSTGHGCYLADRIPEEYFAKDDADEYRI